MGLEVSASEVSIPLATTAVSTLCISVDEPSAVPPPPLAPPLFADASASSDAVEAPSALRLRRRKRRLTRIRSDLRDGDEDRLQDGLVASAVPEPPGEVHVVCQECFNRIWSQQLWF